MWRYGVGFAFLLPFISEVEDVHQAGQYLKSEEYISLSSLDFRGFIMSHKEC
jgi:hypothetical protein